MGMGTDSGFPTEFLDPKQVIALMLNQGIYQVSRKKVLEGNLEDIWID